MTQLKPQLSLPYFLAQGRVSLLRPGHNNFQIDLKAKGLFVDIGVSVLF